MIVGHWSLADYIREHQLPIYLEQVLPGAHPPYEFHDHTFSEIVFVTHGEAEHVIQYCESAGAPQKILSAKIQAGDLLVIHPGTVHAYAKTETLGLYNVAYERKQLALPLLDGYELPLIEQFFPVSQKIDDQECLLPIAHLTDAEMVIIAPQLAELERVLSGIRPGSLLETLVLFLRLVVSLAKMREVKSRPPKQDNYTIGKVINFMTTNYSRPLSLEQLARGTNMSKRNFCRKFRLMTGTSPAQYLLNLRIHHAAELLKNSSLSLSAIAFQCGFYDSNYFAKQFKKVRQVSPREFRKQLLTTE